MSLPFTPTSITPIFHGARSSITATPFDKAKGFGKGTADFDWGDSYDDGGLDEEDVNLSWDGAVVYRQSSSVSHIEYCTTLERLGLGKILSELSRSTAAAMGLRLTKAVKEFLDGTPVLVSVDVTRKKHNVIRLDAIVRTVISLGCNRCGELAAESVFSSFTLLLTEDPVDMPEVINLGVIYGEDKLNPSADDEAGIDLDDRLYFPSRRQGNRHLKANKRPGA